MGNISDAAAAAGAYPQNTVNTGIEQIYSPVVIRREGEGGAGIPTFEVQRPDGASRGAYAAGHLGATRRELDPYFSVYATGDSGDFMKECDYWHVRNYASGTNGEDLNPRKVNRGDISTVGVAHFRGPMILSGWGSDMGDRPVPHVGGDVFTADPEMLNNRGTWKAGPIALLWDTSLTAKKLGEIATITNRDISLTQDYVPDLIFVVAARINYEWLPVWVGCPEDCNAGDSECPTVDCA
jgi:hypothetical protein